MERLNDWLELNASVVGRTSRGEGAITFAVMGHDLTKLITTFQQELLKCINNQKVLIRRPITINECVISCRLSFPNGKPSPSPLIKGEGMPCWNLSS